MSSRPLRPSEFARAHEVFRRIFASGDPFGSPFNALVDKRLLIFPVGMSLDEEIFAAVSRAADEVDERTAYLIDVEQWETISLEDPRRHRWLIDLADYETYSHPPDAYFPIFETALFSEEGTWGLLTSHALHAVAGSANAFVPTLAQALTSSRDEMAVAWLAHWGDLRGRVEEPVEIWLPEHLAHIYGDHDAQQLLVEAGWWRKD